MTIGQKTTLTTSLNEIKSFDPCITGWRDILIGQGKTAPDDVQFPLVDCLKSNSTGDVLWLIGKRKHEILIAVKFARMCADSVAHLNNNYSRRAANAAAAAAAADYADYAAAAANAADAAADYIKQKEKNKQFLIQCISDYEQGMI